ncbi:MAG: hypothetical protein PHF86_00805 [Candidatus Nanoarchaeia archaeon]|nr:hypothetical protein [Candidatus Nanoarchaeia archaeon]
MKNINEGAIKNLLLKSPERDEFIQWAYENVLYGSGDPVLEIREYADIHELTSSEIQDLATLYMEEADEEELNVLSDLVSQIVEAKQLGELDEAEEPIRYTGKFMPISPDNPRTLMHGGKIVGQVGSEKYRKRKLTQKQEDQIDQYQKEISDLEYDISDLKIELEELKSYETNTELEMESYCSNISEEYGEDVLDILNSGILDKIKILDLKNRGILGAKEIVSNFNQFMYDIEKKEKGEDDNSVEIKQKQKEIKDKEKNIESLENKIEKIENSIYGVRDKFVLNK